MRRLEFRMNRGLVSRGKERGIVRGEGAFEPGEFRTVHGEEINTCRVDSVGFHGRICHREKKKDAGMGQRRQNEGGREQEVYAVAVGPLEEQFGGFHFFSDVATTVG